jgi:hypothetical protein
MSNVIQFLESMAANAAMARMSIADYEAAVSVLAADQLQKDGLLECDARKLKDAVNGRDTLFCLVLSPSEHEEQQAPEKKDEEEETPSQSE